MSKTAHTPRADEESRTPLDYTPDELLRLAGPALHAHYRFREAARILSAMEAALRKPSAAVEPSRTREDLLHTAVCQAVASLNQGGYLAAHRLLREVLVEYAAATDGTLAAPQGDDAREREVVRRLREIIDATNHAIANEPIGKPNAYIRSIDTDARAALALLSLPLEESATGEKREREVSNG